MIPRAQGRPGARRSPSFAAHTTRCYRIRTLSLILLLSIFPAIAAADNGLLGDLHWRSIGPGQSGGRVAAVAGTDADSSLYYIGAADGGVFRTTNGGATWDDVWAHQPVAAIGALAIAPSAKRVIWVGTGESKPRNDASYGDGVWLSEDGGASWLHRGLENSYAISRILVSSRDPHTALAGALGDPFVDSEGRGVYRTTDGGATWQKTLYVAAHSGVADLAWDVHGERLVFAAVWQFRRVPWSFKSGGVDDGIYRSTDGGVTWSKLEGHGLPGGLMGRIGVAVAPSDPQRVYALIQSKEGVLWRSDDAGASWRLVSRDTALNQRPFYMSRLEVDPHDANHVFFLSEDLYESKDSGATFRSQPGAVHQDHHAMWIARDGKRMIEGDDGAAPISLDGGAIWTWGYNIAIGQVYRLGLDRQNPYQVCGGLQDNDGFCGPADSLDPLGNLAGYWRDVGNDGDGSWAVPDLLDPQYVWNVGVNQLTGQLGLYDARTRSNHDISPYVRDTNGWALAGLPYRFNWEAPIALAPLDPRVAYFGGNVVFRTADRGQHWSAISPDLTRDEAAHQQVAGGPINTDVSGAEFYDTLLCIAPSSVDAGVIWAGTDDGLVQLTRDGGAHWSDVTPSGVGPYGRVENIDPSPHDAATAFAAIDRHNSGDRTPYAFVTHDYGKTWRSIATGLPDGQYVHVVRQDPRNADIMYAGLEQGIWLSLDGGATWQSLQGDMPVTAARDLRVQPQADDLVVATHGRDFFILDDLTALQQLAQARAAGTYLFKPRTTYAWYRWWHHIYGTGAGEAYAPRQMFVGENPPDGALITYYLSVPVKPAPAIEILDASGRLVRSFPATGHAGLNRLAWNLTEAPPHEWRSAKEWNRGPSDGAGVVPGVYTVRLRASGTTLAQTLVMKADPRAHWTQAEYVARYALLHQLNAELSQIDDALNALDLRAKHGGLDAASQARYDQLSSNPRNSEDDMYRPDMLRERIQTLAGTLSLSQGPPSPAQRAEAAGIETAFNALFPTYRYFTVPRSN